MDIPGDVGLSRQTQVSVVPRKFRERESDMHTHRGYGSDVPISRKSGRYGPCFDSCIISEFSTNKLIYLPTDLRILVYRTLRIKYPLTF